MAGGRNRRRRRRLAEATAVALLVAGILATAAVSALRVYASSVEFRAVTPYEFSNGNRVYRDYDVVVEPYHDAFRTGYRARPRVGQQSGPIGTSDGDCIGNGVVNDVVCSVFSRSITVDLENGGKNDAVALRENQRESELPGGNHERHQLRIAVRDDVDAGHRARAPRRRPRQLPRRGPQRHGL